MRLWAFILLILPIAALAQAAPEPIVPLKKTVAPIVAKTLEAPKLDMIGVTGGFTQSVWAGSNIEDVTRLLAQQNLGDLSAADHQLLVRLLTTANAPESKQDGEWLKVRLQLLLLLGEEKAFKDMMALVPAASRTEALDRLIVEQELLQLSGAKVCEKVSASIAKYKDIFWLQANAFCLAKAKKSNEAELALQLLSEQHTDAKSAFPFEETIRKMLGDTSKIAPVKTFNLSPLELAVSIEAGLFFDPQIDKDKGDITPAAARFLVLNSKLSLNTRTQLAERIFRMGALPRESLTEFYKQQTFKLEILEKKQFPVNPVEARAMAFVLSEKKPELIPELRKQFPADLAQRLFAPDAPNDNWRKYSPAKDVRVAVVHKAFGIAVASDIWKNVAAQNETSVSANAAALDILKETAALKRMGETALLGLQLMQYRDNSVTLLAVLQAFRMVGLEKEANSLAQEALLQYE